MAWPGAEVDKLIASCDAGTPAGQRDRAILLFLARLGLRAGDVMSLRLPEIDWADATFKVSGKGRRELRLPLPQDVGDAVLTYLQSGRPKVAFKYVFVTVRPPWRPLTSNSTVSGIVGRASQRAGVDAPTHGSHSAVAQAGQVQTARRAHRAADAAEGRAPGSTRAVHESLSYTDFVLALLQAETAARRTRSIDRGLKRANLGTVEGLDGFDFARRPQLDPRIVKELFNLLFIQERRNVICVGKPGLGKTRIGKALVHTACMAGYSALCVVTADMLMELHAAQADRTYKRVFRKYVKPELLFLDEFAYEPFDTEATCHLFRIVSARHKTGSIIIAANCGFTAWKKLFPSEERAVATVDRLVDQATILRFTGLTDRGPREITGAPLDE